MTTNGRCHSSADSAAHRPHCPCMGPRPPSSGEASAQGTPKGISAGSCTPSNANCAREQSSSNDGNLSTNLPVLKKRSPKGQNRDPADDAMAEILRLSSAESERLANGAKRLSRCERRGRQPRQTRTPWESSTAPQ